MLLRRRDADDHVGAERTSQLREPTAARLTAHPPHDFADQVPVRIGVVRVACPGLPPRGGGGERSRHGVPVPQIVVGQRLVDRRHSSSVAERVAQRGPLLALGGELRPDGGDRIVQRDAPGIDQLQCQQGYERLADRVEVDQRVELPRRVGSPIGPAARQVDHGVAVDHDAYRCAHLTALGEVARELLAHTVEAGVALARDLDVHSGTLSRTWERRKRGLRSLSHGAPRGNGPARCSGRPRPRPAGDVAQKGCPTREVADHQALDLPAVVGAAQRHGVARVGRGAGRPPPRRRTARHPDVRATSRCRW